MATKQIPFSLEMVKKIQAGEIKGTIKTRDGRAARFICEIRNNEYPLLFICSNGQREWAYHYTIDGFYYLNGENGEYNLILEIEDEQKKPEHQFKPFDKVLVRNNDDEEWETSYFSHIQNIYGKNYYLAGNVRCKQCIPYAGNEYLVGTTNKPKED